MDPRTSQYYATYAEEVAERYERAGPMMLRYLRLAFRPGSRVLDVGAGSGRDLRLLAAEGVDAYGIEPVDALRRVAVARSPGLEARLRAGHLPDLREEERFDGVLCAAVLHHIERAQLFDAAFNLRALLKWRGRLLISVPSPPPDTEGPTRELDGRLHNGVAADELDLLFVRLGFQRIERWDEPDALGRPDRTWTTLLYRLDVDGDAASIARPLDLVQAVLVRDRKTATYKPALLRALTDIALTQPKLVRWSRDRVLVPLSAIANRWILYYWPIFESKDFLPQIRMGGAATGHGLGFAKELSALIELYRRAGGLSAFALGLREETLDGDASPLYRKLMKRLRATIVRGPVRHAGGSLDMDRLFDLEGDHVVVDAALWKELSVSGYWIRDALLLRWAGLIVEFSGKAVGLDQAVAALCVEPTSEREQEVCRQAFAGVPELRCVWSDRSLVGTRFDVDHVIPFSLWRNNDLWNLVPAHPMVNQKKSDRLPTRELLLRRKEALLRCWDVLRGAATPRFEREARTLVGRDSWNSSELFSVVAESIEVTATQTGTLRYSG